MSNKKGQKLSINDEVIDQLMVDAYQLERQKKWLKARSVYQLLEDRFQLLLEDEYSKEAPAFFALKRVVEWFIKELLCSEEEEESAINLQKAFTNLLKGAIENHEDIFDLDSKHETDFYAKVIKEWIPHINSVFDEIPETIQKDLKLLKKNQGFFKKDAILQSLGRLFAHRGEVESQIVQQRKDTRQIEPKQLATSLSYFILSLTCDSEKSWNWSHLGEVFRSMGNYTRVFANHIVNQRELAYLCAKICFMVAKWILERDNQANTVSYAWILSHMAATICNDRGHLFEGVVKTDDTKQKKYHKKKKKLTSKELYSQEIAGIVHYEMGLDKAFDFGREAMRIYLEQNNTLYPWARTYLGFTYYLSGLDMTNQTIENSLMLAMNHMLSGFENDINPLQRRVEVDTTSLDSYVGTSFLLSLAGLNLYSSPEALDTISKQNQNFVVTLSKRRDCAIQMLSDYLNCTNDNSSYQSSSPTRKIDCFNFKGLDDFLDHGRMLFYTFFSQVYFTEKNGKINIEYQDKSFFRDAYNIKYSELVRAFEGHVKEFFAYLMSEYRTVEGMDMENQNRFNRWKETFLLYNDQERTTALTEFLYYSLCFAALKKEEFVEYSFKDEKEFTKVLFNFLGKGELPFSEFKELLEELLKSKEFSQLYHRYFKPESDSSIFENLVSTPHGPLRFV